MWVAGFTHVVGWRQPHSVSGEAKTETLSAPSTNLHEKKAICSARLHARKVQQLSVSCIFQVPIFMLCAMLNSGGTANLLLAVLFISVQADSIQNQGRLFFFAVLSHG